ncbi:MAG: tryptophan synthase subunit alpha [Calditrichaeota bacterium]|nr:tryptophan synthase subunit alpha [Calditrichota bacterium]
MNRIEQHLVNLKKNNEKALILFLTAGDPSLEATFDIMCALAQNGADCIEIGVPFSDPVADGPVIQRATSRAILNNVRLEDILKLIQKFRESYETPLVCMGYFNPIVRFGEENFCRAFHQAGGDGLIIADLPYEEGENMEDICRQNDISLIYLLAPEIGSERTQKILDASSGFVYCVSHFGTTGTNEGPDVHVDQVVRSLKSMTSLPVAVGFGISSIEKAKETSREADGIIIGSWLLQELERTNDKAKKAAEFAKAVKNAITKQG